MLMEKMLLITKLDAVSNGKMLRLIWQHMSMKKVAKNLNMPKQPCTSEKVIQGCQDKTPCNAGNFFIRWRQFCDEYLRQEGLPPSKKTDYVFFNPYTNRPCSYTHFYRTWDECMKY